MPVAPSALTSHSRTGAGYALAVLAVSVLLSMSVWFSASFLIPQFRELWSLDEAQASLLTIAVQLGFVAGALGIAACGLADRVSGRRLMLWGGLGAAAANALLLLAPGFAAAVALRALTGAMLAAVYPSAMKEASSWFKAGRGTALGIMIGALTLGSAAPQLVKAAYGTSAPWQAVIAATSILSALGGLIVLLLRVSGPYPFASGRFRVREALRAVRNRSAILANIGYVGHMWELYAMWAWVGTFLASRPGLTGEDAAPRAALATFFCIGVGAAGCLVGGFISDRTGRSRAALIALTGSGTAAVTLALTHTAPTPAVLIVTGIWGFWVVADSAQFSAILTENVDAPYVGSAISLQLGLGYLTTAATIYLVPVLVHAASWSAALLVLAAGPTVGALAMILHMRAQRIAPNDHQHSRIRPPEG